MRRGRKRTTALLTAAAALFSTALFLAVPAALAGGGTPMDICQDLQDGTLNGNYTAAQLRAYADDPTVQGYCSPLVTAQPAASPPASTPPASGTPSAGVAGATHTQTAPPSPPSGGVKGTVHTAAAPPAQAVAPATAVHSSGTLPFTGAQLTLFAVVGLALLATGLLLRGSARARSRPRS